MLHTHLGPNELIRSTSAPSNSNQHTSRSARDCCNVLKALEVIADRLNGKLQVLGLHNMPHSSFQHCMQLSRVFAQLPTSLTGLSCTFMDTSLVVETEKKFLFKVCVPPCLVGYVRLLHS